jgi:hypothetical protein
LSIRPTVRAEPADTVTVRLVAFVPAAFPTVSVTAKVPAEVYVWVGFCSVLVPPSPKLQDHAAGEPVEASVNCTDTLADGDAGENVKSAAGADGEDDEDEDEAESPQAKLAHVPSARTDAASQALKGSARVVVMVVS